MSYPYHSIADHFIRDDREDLDGRIMDAVVNRRGVQAATSGLAFSGEVSKNALTDFLDGFSVVYCNEVDGANCSWVEAEHDTDPVLPYVVKYYTSTGTTEGEQEVLVRFDKITEAIGIADVIARTIESILEREEA